MKKLYFLLLLVVTLIVSISLPQTSYAYDNTRYNWGFKKSRNEEGASAGEKFDKMLESYSSFYIGDTSKKEIYLTFDNGYENGYSEQVLDILKEKKVPATFFITGHYVKDQPELVKRMVNEGHIVGNHSWHHPDLTTVSDQKLKEELQSVEKAVAELTSQKSMTYLRAPRGVFSERTLALSEQLGYVNVFWSLAFVDWKTDQQKGWKYAYDNIMRQIHPGAVMLLHSVSKDNADALGKAIDDLRAKGYEFKSLNDYMFDKLLPAPFYNL
ncbi:delta-lactam-biosynthetic de-N-acetylase [Bacillus solimangrovi]|uniref:Delta-lactam-biosynthetic de-N-acetylase n=1 Tax=Bacillus solimangrovi TaxID=1305675 RepID=A0A1E5LB81_9BACI|nr:delta-lactam-biosynthetic de-N-acetylase [Bacillus solimangrovi]OEH91341.1 delta-lactam-biosynthetic de-N-acetylase [Bacillus solimangrovi]